MSSPAELHLTYQVANAPLSMFPFPHLFIREAFPGGFYRELQSMLPDPRAMRTLEEARGVKGYDERFVFEFREPQVAALPAPQQAFWRDFHAWLVGGRFAQLVLQKFGPFVNQRFQNQPGVRFHDEALLVNDVTNYKLGPHTDAQRKVVTMLFYLPPDESQRHLGTSIYLPKDRAFTCRGGPHYRHEEFDRLWTMPFLPNSLFAFLKTENSFHGVEPVADPDTRRWLLLYDIYHRRDEAPPSQGAKASS